MLDKAGRIWFGTNKGIYVYDPLTHPGDTPLFTSLLPNAAITNTDGLQLIDVTSMLQDTEGNMWFTSAFFQGEGICCFDGSALTSFAPDGISSGWRSIEQGPDGRLYFLNTYHGIYCWDGKYFSNFSRQIGLKNDTLMAMEVDHAGHHWFGTNSDDMFNGGRGGVWRYYGDSLKLFTTKDGLSHNCIFCITEDREGNLWFGTRNTGLCRYDGRSFTDFTD